MDRRNSPTISPGREKLDPRVWRIVGVALLGPLITNIDSTVVNVSLNALGHDLHVPLITLQWVITGYLLALALMLPLSGWLVDRCGAKRVYLGCFALFTVASLLCGLSTSASMLIGARILQGMAGGLLAPMAQMMVAREAPRHMARVMGTMVVPVILGPIFGPSLAGLILQHASWHWIFFINLPIGILAVVLATWILPSDEKPEKRRAFDFAGFLMLSPALVLLLYSLEELSTHPAALMLHALLIGASITLLVFFSLHAKRRGDAALVDLYLFGDRSFRTSAALQFLTNGLALGSQMLIPLYLLTILHMTPTTAGLVLASGGIGAMCAYPFMGALSERIGFRKLAAGGATLSLAANIALALLPASRLGIGLLCFLLFSRAVGMASISIPSVASAYAGIPRAAVPVATTALNIVQRLGGPTITTVIAICLHTAVRRHETTAATAGFTETFWLLCLLSTLMLLASLRLPLRMPAARPEQREEIAALAEATTE